MTERMQPVDEEAWNGELNAPFKLGKWAKSMPVPMPVYSGSSRAIQMPAQFTNAPREQAIPKNILNQTGGVIVGGQIVGAQQKPPIRSLPPDHRLQATLAEQDKASKGIFSTVIDPRDLPPYRTMENRNGQAEIEPAPTSPTRYGPRVGAGSISAGGVDLGVASPLFGMVPSKYRQTVNSVVSANTKLPRPSRPEGPMSGIYSERPVGDMQQKYLQGLGLRQQYNEAQPRSQERADVLNEIWDRGGVPVIGGGTQRAPVQDFGGVNGVMDSMAKVRGVDTGMKVGSPEAEAHGLALAKHRGGDVYGGGDRAAHLRRNRETASQGLLNTWGDERAMQKEAAQVALDQARKGGGLNLTPDQALKQYEVDQRTAVDREKIAAADRRAQEARDAEANAKAAAEAARGIREVNGVFIGPDDKPLAEPEQKMWSARKTALTSVAEPQTVAAIKEMQKNPDAYAVRIDRTTGKVAVGPSKRKGMFGEKDAEWLGETLPDKTPRYVTPYEYDPVIAGVLYSQYGI